MLSESANLTAVALSFSLTGPLWGLDLGPMSIVLLDLKVQVQMPINAADRSFEVCVSEGMRFHRIQTSSFNFQRI